MAKFKLILIQVTLVLFVSVNEIRTFFFEVPKACKNSNGQTSVCVSIYDCPPLLNESENCQQHGSGCIRNSECVSNEQDGSPYVCCAITDLREGLVSSAEDPNIAATKTGTQIKTLDSSLFPKPPKCGPVTIGNKIYGGEEADLGEFPWLANLEYETSNGDLTSDCAGNIINERYLLTAGHCIVSQIGALVSVRVGDQNKEAPLDCSKSKCSGFQRLRIEKTIVHDDYQPYGTNDGYRKNHDIALIRTDKKIKYSASVAPICLPNEIISQLPQLRSGLRLFVAGWGQTEDAENSGKKRKVELPYIENENCRFIVAPEQLCAGGEIGKDSCFGDSGAGLVRLVGNAWILEGLVSYGLGCGLKAPAVYTRVSSHISWIRSNVEL